MDSGGRPVAPVAVEYYLPNYKMGKTLGIGSFGKVKVAEHTPTGHKVAIKILNRRKVKSMDMEEKVRREIKILRLFMHPHIIRLYEVIETPTDIFVVMEYVKSGELFDYIVEKQRLGEDEARRFFQQIVSGVEYCHRNMVVHRDLKPENLLLDSKWNVKIADFGLSNIMRDGHFLKTSCGSPNYAAPEVISGKLYAGPEVDVWSCGVILYALLCGSLPFDDENIPNLFRKIKGGIYTLPSHLSPGARDLIPRMLLVDPMKRVTIPEIRQHPWFLNHLPRYLAVPPPDTLQQAKRIDEEILERVVALNFDRVHLIESLLNRVQNKATVAYYLMLDNRRRLSNGYLGSEFDEGKEQSLSPMSPYGAHGGTPRSTYPRSLIRTPSMDRRGSSSSVLQHRVVAERKWALGVQLRSHPKEIMSDVLDTLRKCDINWKKTGAYNLKCRWVAPNQHLNDRASEHRGIPDSPMAGTTPRVSSGRWSSEQQGISGSVASGNKDDESGVESNVLKFELQVILFITTHLKVVNLLVGCEFSSSRCEKRSICWTCKEWRALPISSSTCSQLFLLSYGWLDLLKSRYILVAVWLDAGMADVILALVSICLL
ncbi:SNF1-related protein kinase catalytic subunit alpha KIN10 isoform X2 [Physcomitrium patens]|uniref:SNF1-related protein kinase catalytic subunit alpha KIN10 isoform X2 n=1 Tax=Physcomitrium patens TaxID=3218 RepID=UPI000D179CA4|nr:serine/threonine protein kinase OSK1-like isoform X2 [Physcomitrium patens]|eukprot:XP_024367035.1 serine/threonine protein kinase OSK1-like isoform X2 [Physcomitrella patens]